MSHLECEVCVGEGDGVEVDGGLQMVGAQHGDGLIESRLKFKFRRRKLIVLTLFYSVSVFFVSFGSLTLINGHIFLLKFS